jgi:hypothetical protein
MKNKLESAFFRFCSGLPWGERHKDLSDRVREDLENMDFNGTSWGTRRETGSWVFLE